MSTDLKSLDALRIERVEEPSAAAGNFLRRPLVWATAGAVVVAALGATVVVALGPIEVATVRAESAPAAATRANGVLNASGYVVARRVATVSSKITGRVVEVLIEEGNSVANGQLLARLDASSARAIAQMSRDELEASRRNLTEIEVRLAQAERDLERTRNLRARSLVSESALDTAQADARAQRARLEAQRAQTDVAESTLALHLQDLAELDVYAPFAGVVISKDAQPGETVSPSSGGGAFTRTGIATIVDMESLEIAVDVNESYISRVSQGQRVEAMLDAYPNDALLARVINIVPTADRQKATVRVRIGFEKLEPRILPDMGVKVRFLDDEPLADVHAGKPAASRLVSVPSAAVRRDGDEPYVWLVRDGRAARQPVVLGTESDGRVELKSGVMLGEELIASAVDGLHEGSRVRSRT
jgi:RND family efflux transporter MFP subunit